LVVELYAQPVAPERSPEQPEISAAKAMIVKVDSFQFILSLISMGFMQIEGCNTAWEQ
jgi:hypothetical protein